MPSLTLNLRRPEFIDRWNTALTLRLSGWKSRLAPYWTDPDKRRRSKKVLLIGGPVAAVVLGLGAWMVFGPPSQPDYGSDPLDDVFNYTLLTDEFNKLPLKERMDLIGQLVRRLKDMSPGDSAMMAAFAAGIAGAARDQIEKNVATMAIDVFDDYAKRYVKVPEADRPAFMDQAYIEFTRMMESMAGQDRPLSDEDRIAEAQRETKREEDRIGRRLQRDSARAGAEVGRGMAFMADRMRDVTSSPQRARMGELMRDMTRHFRGQDIESGKRKTP